MPACIVHPQRAEDVSKAVLLLTSVHSPAANLSACEFAIRGGGHAPWAGAANIDGGVTIDLSGMKDVIVSENRTVVSIGPGATWEDVYLALDAQNLSTSGGRVSSVGVAGLTLGGTPPPYLLTVSQPSRSLTLHQVVSPSSPPATASSAIMSSTTR